MATMVCAYFFSVPLQEGQQGSSGRVVCSKTDRVVEGHTPHHVDHVGMGSPGHHLGLLDVVHEVLTILHAGCD